MTDQEEIEALVNTKYHKITVGQLKNTLSEFPDDATVSIEFLGEDTHQLEIECVEYQEEEKTLFIQAVLSEDD